MNIKKLRKIMEQFRSKQEIDKFTDRELVKEAESDQSMYTEYLEYLDDLLLN